MKHTPYGYKIVDGKVLIDEEKAANLRKICENYLSGMSFINAAADVGLSMPHGRVKHLIQDSRYLGSGFYPRILSEEMAQRIEEERIRRAKALGRDHRACKKQPEPTIWKSFSIPRVPKKHEDPIKQAEYAYSLIQSEVSG